MEKTFKREVLDRLQMIEIKLDGYGNLKAKVYENEKSILLLCEEMKDVKEELKKQQEENVWVKRTVIAAIITGVVGIGIAFLRVNIGV